MVFKIYSIFDSKVESYLQPFFFRNAGEAQRAVANLVNDANHGFSKHAEDYTLFEIGQWDDEKARIIMHDAKFAVCTLLELKKG